MRLSYLLIKGIDKVSNDDVLTITNLLQDMMPSASIKQDEDFLVIILDSIHEYDFKDFITTTNAELLSNLYLYESGVFSTVDELKIDVSHKKMELKFDLIYSSEKTAFYTRMIDYIEDKYKKQVLKEFYDNEEFLYSLKIFIEKNQNTSEAAKFLYMHRNTLINRLDKFFRITGYDLRKFEDALIIYLLVKDVK